MHTTLSHLFSSVRHPRFRAIALVTFLMPFLMLAHAAPALAVWDGTPYDPEETLNPECPPEEGDCRVTLPVRTGEGVPAGSIPYTTGTDDWDALLIGADGKVLKVQGGTLVWADDNGGTAYSASEQSLKLDPNTHVFALALDGDSLSQSGSGLKIADGYLGQASISTVGTITSGTWQGTALAPAYGGTGTTATPANGQLLIGTGTGFSVANVTGSGGVSITNGAGTLGIGFSIDDLASMTSASWDDQILMYQESTGQNKKIAFNDFFGSMSGSLNYRGNWNANTNTPSLSDGQCAAGSKGYYYVVSVAGSTTLSGISSWDVNDWAICNGTAWTRIETTNAVTSVFGRIGPVTAQAGDYTAGLISSVASGTIAATTVQGALDELATEKEGVIAPGLTSQYWRGDKTWQALTTGAVTEVPGSLYYTDVRARAAFSSASASLSYSSTTGVFAITADYSMPLHGNTAGETLAWNGSAWTPTTLLTVSTSTNTVAVSGTTALATTTATGLTLSTNGLALASSLPTSVTNHLYNQAGVLYWDGAPIADGSSGLVSAGLSTGDLAVWSGSDWESAPGLSVSAGVLEVEGTASSTSLRVNGVATTTDLIVTSGARIASSTITALSATTANLTNASTTALSVSGTLSLGTLNGVLFGTNGLIAATTTLAVGTGGTGSNAFTLNGLVFGNGAGALQATAAGGVGTVLIGGGAPTFTNALTLGASVTAPLVNATAGLQLNGANINTAGTLSNLAYLSQPQTFTGLQTFAGNASTTGLTVTGGAYLATTGGNVGIGTTSPSAKLAVQAAAGVNSLLIGSSTATTLIVDANGRVGIGTSTPNAPLHVKGDVAGVSARFETSGTGLVCNVLTLTGVVACSSDETLKKDIVALEDQSMLKKVLDLRPVSYRWRTDDASAGLKYGFIAQDVEAIFPSLVSVDPVTGKRTLATTGLIPFMVQAFKEQQAQIDALAAGDALSVPLLDRLIAQGALSASGHVAFGADTVGEAIVRAGDTRVDVSFSEAYGTAPVVTVTPQGAVRGAYWVTDVSTTGFSIMLDIAQQERVPFSWHAFARTSAAPSLPPETQETDTDPAPSILDDGQPGAQDEAPSLETPEPEEVMEPKVEEPVTTVEEEKEEVPAPESTSEPVVSTENGAP